MHPVPKWSRQLRFETLERRIVLSLMPLSTAADIADSPVLEPSQFEFKPLIMAGDPNHPTDADSPIKRVDGNTTDSPYAGVGSLFMRQGRFLGYICTATPIDALHVLTAAHCLDTSGNGSSNFKPNQVTFYLNFGGDLTHSFQAASLHIHPDFTGFGNPSVNDDLAVIRLNEVLPARVPLYTLHQAAVSPHTRLELVGYGQSGDGVNGTYVDASFSVKRSGENNADGFGADDEGKGTIEVYYADFDAPDGSNGFMGGPSLGNTVETTLGGGDSGGPAFVQGATGHELAAVNTFAFRESSSQAWGTFGTGLGGILVYPYLEWIDGVLAGGSGDGGSGGGGGKGNGKGPKATSEAFGDDLGFPAFFAVGWQHDRGGLTSAAADWAPRSGEDGLGLRDSWLKPDLVDRAFYQVVQEEDRSGLPLGRRAVGQSDEHDLLKSALGIDAAEDELLEIVGSL